MLLNYSTVNNFDKYLRSQNLILVILFTNACVHVANVMLGEPNVLSKKNINNLGVQKSLLSHNVIHIHRCPVYVKELIYYEKLHIPPKSTQTFIKK
jgi:hypothetical protein